MSATSLRVRWVTPQLCRLVPLAPRAISQCLPIKSSKSSKSSLYWNSVLTPGSSLKFSFRFRFFWNANWASEWVLNSVFAVLLIWDLRAVTLHEYLQELTCSHIVWFWFWRLASRLHTLAKHPRVTLHLRLYARSARYAKPMQNHFGFASTSLSHVSEMPQRCRPNAVWFTLVGCGWPKLKSSKSSRSCRPLTSSFADGEQGCFGCQSLCLCPRTQLKDKIGKKTYDLKTARNSYFCCKMLNS